MGKKRMGPSSIQGQSNMRQLGSQGGTANQALAAENARLREALELCIDSARELRRNISPDHGCGYATYRDTWDASMRAEIAAIAAMEAP